MSGVMGKFLVSGIVLSSIVACSSSSEDNKYKAPTAVAYACDFKFTDGGQADYSALGTRSITATYFEKEYNLSYLNAVGLANVETTIDFVNQTGVTIYKSKPLPRNLCGFSLFETAAKLTPDLQAKWDKSTAKDGEEGEGYTLGLYLPKVVSSDFPSLLNGAAIIVRENTDRWTIVHEFMHHLFMLRSIEKGYNDAQMKANLTNSWIEFQGSLKDASLTEEQKISKAAFAYAKYAQAYDELLVHYFLEEMTIEATLKDASTTGALKFVPTDDDNWYLSTSADKAVAEYDSTNDDVDTILRAVPDSMPAEKAALNGVKANTDKRKATVAVLRQRFPYKKRSATVGALLAGRVHNHNGCSHSAEGEKLIEINKQVHDAVKNLL